ncbi:MAG: cytochrome c oxidase subunit II [Thermomicrobiales bacterium]
MERRAGGVEARRSMTTRVLSLVGLAAVALFALAACGDDNSFYTTISPRTETADDIQFLYKVIFFMSLVVFVGVQAAIVYTVLRFRRRSDDDARPEQVHGNKTLEIVWTIIPAIVLLIIFIPTVSTLYDFDAEAQDGEYVIDVYGKQWWWEVHYREPDTVAEVITANEIRVPTGRDILFRLYSNNVIHSFWVPQLTGKMDVVPGHENKLSFTVPQPGVYYGECAEFCGEAHAWMRFQVIAEPQEQFDAWIAAWNAGPNQAAAAISGDVAAAPPDFGACIACHRVSGTNADAAAVGIETDRTAGPNLTLFGCRSTIAAGMLANTPENLHAWIEDAPSIKPGSHMPPYGEEAGGQLSSEQIDVVVDYLLSLTPEGGCTPLTGENVDATPVADQ